MAKFYAEHLLKLRANVTEYSNKKLIDISNLNIDELMVDIESTHQRIMKHQYTQPSMTLSNS